MVKKLHLYKYLIFINSLLCGLIFSRVSNAAISVVSAIKGSIVDGLDVTLTFPSGSVQQGDVVVVYGGFDPQGAGQSANITTTGYTSIANSTTTNISFGTWYKVMGATPDTSVVGKGGGNNRTASAYAAYILRGVDQSRVLDSIPSTTGPTSSTNPDPPPVTTSIPGTWVIPVVGSNVYDTSVTAPTNYSNLNGSSGNDNNDISTYASTRTISSPGSENPGTYGSWSSGYWYAVTMAISPETEPSVALNSLAVGATITFNNPVFDFTGYDYNGDDIRYNIQIDNNSDFSSPLIDKVSGTDAGFSNPDDGGDTDPFNNNENIQYAVQSADYLAEGTYYWRVRGIDPNGGNAYGAWSTSRSFRVELPDYSGVIYQTNESSPYLCNTSGNLTVYLRVNGSGTYSGTCNADTGVWSIANVSVPAVGNTVLAYLSGGSVRGSTVLVTDAITKTDVSIMQDRVIVRDDYDSTITNADISAGNTSDADDLVTISGSDYTTSSNYETHIWTGDSYAPGGNVSTGKLHVVGNYTGSTETLSLTGSGTGTSRPLYIDGGTFTAPTTTQYQGTSTSSLESTTYNNLYLNPTITSAVSYTFLGAVTVNNAFTINPTAASSYALTVYLGGTLSLTSSNTITVSGTTSGTSVLDTVSGSNYAISAGFLNIAAAGTLNANNSTITLNGTTGTIFTRTGTFNAGNGTVLYSQSSGDTTLTSGTVTYYNLQVNMSGRTGALGNTITVGNNLYVQAGTLDDGGYQITGNATGTLTLASGNSLRLGSAASATAFPTLYTTDHIALEYSSTVVYQAAASQTISSTPSYWNLSLLPTITGAVGYTTDSGTVTVKGEFVINPSSAGANALTLTQAGPINVYDGRSTTITATGSATSTLDTAGYALTTGNMDIQSAGTLLGRTAIITVHGNWTRSGTFTPATSTVVFDTSTNTSTLTGATTFYNFECVTPRKQINFPGGVTQTIATGGTFRIHPQTTCGNSAILRSTNTSQWVIAFAGSNTIDADYVDVAYADASGSTVNVANAINSGNNSANWILSNGTCGASAIFNFTGVGLEGLNIIN